MVNWKIPVFLFTPFFLGGGDSGDAVGYHSNDSHLCSNITSKHPGKHVKLLHTKGAEFSLPKTKNGANFPWQTCV